MGFLLKQIFQFIKLLNSETGTNQISTGIAAGFILGMTPFFSLQSILVFICLLIFRIQMGAAFLSAAFFAFIGYLLDPLFDTTGRFILEFPAWHPFFTQLYNLPIIPLTRFYNSIVMGSGVISLLLSPLIFWLARITVIKYRVQIVERFKSSHFWKVIQATSLYKWYYKYDQLFGS